MTWVHKPEGGPIDMRGGRKWPMPKGCVLPCAGCPKVPESAPEKSPRFAEELDDRLWTTYRHYRKCRAVNRWPEDQIVEWAADIIRDVEDEIENGERQKLTTTLLLLKRT